MAIATSRARGGRSLSATQAPSPTISGCVAMIAVAAAIEVSCTPAVQNPTYPASASPASPSSPASRRPRRRSSSRRVSAESASSGSAASARRNEAMTSGGASVSRTRGAAQESAATPTSSTIHSRDATASSFALSIVRR